MTEQERLQAALEDLENYIDAYNSDKQGCLKGYALQAIETIRDTLTKYAALLPLVEKIVEAKKLTSPGEWKSSDFVKVEGKKPHHTKKINRQRSALGSFLPEDADFAVTAATIAAEMQKILEGKTK